MNKEKLNQCLDCKYCNYSIFWFECRSPYVTMYGSMDCRIARLGHYCGKGAKYFEPKPKGWFSRLFKR